MNHCECGEVKNLVFAEGVFFCNKCLSMDEEVPYEKTGSIDQQFQVFKEEILEKKEPIEMKQVPTANTKDHPQDALRKLIEILKDNGKISSQEEEDFLATVKAYTLQDFLDFEDNDFNNAFESFQFLTRLSKSAIKSAIRKKKPQEEMDIIKTAQPDLKRKATEPILNQQTKLQKLSIDETINEIKNLNLIPLTFPPSPDSVFYGREDSLKQALNSINEVAIKLPSSYSTTSKGDEKFHLLGTSGMKGIGKTRLLYEIGNSARNMIDGKKVESIYITFNGGGQVKDTFLELARSHLSNSEKALFTYGAPFGHLLLQTCGVPNELASGLTLNQSLALYRRISKMSEEDVLLILVDEIGHLDQSGSNIAESLISSLMSCMDEHMGKLIFIFSHIRQEFLNLQATNSGRVVLPLALPHLDIDIWKNIPGLKKASNDFPALHQLFLSCSGHPRSIFEGIAYAIKFNPTLLTAPNPSAITIARSMIIISSKFNDLSDSYISDAIMKWFSQSPQNFEDLSSWKCSGLLHTMNGTAGNSPVQFLFPLLVQDWARRFSDSHPIAYHLQQLYHADACLDIDSEKKMEAVLYHYEAVLRIAQAGKKFVLQEFFKTIHSDEMFAINVTAPFPSSGHVVKYVPNFIDSRAIFSHLDSGYIVVSEYHSEIGTEYLVPFRKSDNTLMVAFVQCKFVTLKSSWSEIVEKLNKSMQYFVEKSEFAKIEMFRVVYTTTDQTTLRSKTYKGAVYYTENDLFKFTNKLGILRLHTQKLGEKLKLNYPVLKKASSDINL